MLENSVQFDIVKSVLIILPYMQKREEKSVFFNYFTKQCRINIITDKTLKE